MAWLQKLLIPALLCTFSGPVSAAIIAADDFEYAAGELAGANGGTGFGGAWAANAAATNVVDASLSFTDSLGRTLSGGTRALEITGNDANVISRALDSSLLGDDFYVRFLLQWDSGSVGNNNFLSLWHDASASGSHTGIPGLGVKGNNGDGSGPEDFFIRNGLSQSTEYAVDIEVGQTYLIVARLQKSDPTGSNVFDTLQLWVDPSENDFGSPDAVVSATSPLSSFATTGFRTANLSGDVVLLDALAWGDDFVSVVAVPEPGTGALVAVGFLGLGISRRLSRRCARCVS